MSLTDRLEEQAHRLGFSLFGVATPLPPAHHSTYLAWLARGHYADMAYLATPEARHKRAHPANLMPSVRSVIVLGYRYPSPLHVNQTSLDPLHGRIAAYAWGEDYHHFLPTLMKEMIGRISSEVDEGVTARFYTDTGAILERDFAQQAGLGWIGKNSCLISPRQGSFHLLAEILLTVEIPPTASFDDDRCGTCTRCIDACPTHCILPDRTLDANRCISYLTIENKGLIPRKLRPLMDNWIFGCDICQMVCPWNLRLPERRASPFFQKEGFTPYPELLGELGLTPRDFNQKYRSSPIHRARRRGYLRNICVALGNAGNPAALPALREILAREAEPLIRGHAAWAIGQIKHNQSHNLLNKALKLEVDPLVRQEILFALNSDVS